MNCQQEPDYDEPGYEYNEEYCNDEVGTTKDLLTGLSSGNGDIRSSSLSNKRRHHHHNHHYHHHSRSRRIPPVVLIPQQSHPSSTLTSSSCLTDSCSHSNLFNSNMHLLEKHLKHLIDKQKREEDRNEIINEWKLMALIMDRLLFWTFTIFTILSTILCLIIIPFLKNAGYIPLLLTDLVTEYKSIETVVNATGEQSRINLTTVSTVDT